MVLLAENAEEWRASLDKIIGGYPYFLTLDEVVPQAGEDMHEESEFEDD